MGVDRKKASEKDKFFDKMKKILEELNIKDEKLVIMIDEFPQTIVNIIRRNSYIDGEQFWQFNRELRHITEGKILFIYTGSIGISSIAEKLDATKQINDLNYVEVSPLSLYQGKDLIRKLLSNEEITISEDALNYIIEKIDYLVPFHIQLVCQNLIDVNYEYKIEINNSMVDKAIKDIL